MRIWQDVWGGLGSEQGSARLRASFKLAASGNNDIQLDLTRIFFTVLVTVYWL